MRLKQLKVTYCNEGNRSRPHIRITGDWLTKYGFDIGDSVVLTAESGRISINKGIFDNREIIA